MTDLMLSFASRSYERTQPLLDGSVRPQGVQLVPTIAHPAETFWRQLKFQDFDISEMSLSSLFIAKERGADLVAIPAFPSRRFFHLELDCRSDSEIANPADLRGRRIGVGDYQQTAALWLRAILEHDFGVSQFDVDWYMERSEELSHGGATGFTPPDGISFTRVPPEKSLASMLLGGEIDAAMIRPGKGKEMINPIVRSSNLPDDYRSKVRPVFQDPVEEGRRFFGAHGYIPINHAFVLKGKLFREHPWVALNFYKACLKAKELAEDTLLERIPLSLVFRAEALAQAREMFGPDPFPYGVSANRVALEQMVSYSHEQGLIKDTFEIEELFAPSTLAWE